MELTCGECRFFKVTGERDDGRLGVCRIEKVMGVFREGMRACSSFSRHGEAAVPVANDGGRRMRAPVRRGESAGSPSVYVSGSALKAVLDGLGTDALKSALVAALEHAAMLREADLGRHWTTGQMELLPADDGLRPKAVALEAYFHKIVMMRDNLRVLEQKVNSHAQLHDAEKVDLQRRVTLAYQALSDLGTAWLPAAHDDGPAADAVTRLRDLLAEAHLRSLVLPAPTLGERWVGGRVRYQVDAEVVDEPMERFFARLVVLRDRLHALEAQIAAHPHIAPDEADAMGSYIRRCYGTLTTYNVLFREREAYFTSSK